MGQLEDELEFAKRIVLRAGEIVLKKAERDIEVKSKGIDGDVTAGDFASNDYLVKQIMSQFPDHGLLSEERDDDKTRLGKERVWIIDPIDGTEQYKKFARSGRNKEFSDWCVQVGLSVGGKASVGALYIPVTGELFYATKGSGAFREFDGKVEQLKVNNKLNGRYKVTRGFLTNPRTAGLVKHMRQRGGGNIERYFGSIGTALASLSKNDEIDAYCQASGEHRLGEWDLCAPEVIASEAGALVTNGFGKRYGYNKPEPFCIPIVIAQRRQGIVI
ncbi:MAG: inositol monophosphatase family protein [archaeon]